MSFVLSPPPWQNVRREVRDEDVLAVRPGEAPTPFIYPQMYGPIPMPVPEQPITDPIVVRPLSLVRKSNVFLLPRHIIIDAETQTLDEDSFLRLPRGYHHGLRREVKSTYRLRRKNQSVDDVAAPIDEPCYYAETDWPHIYGNVLLEVIPRLWAINEADPGVKVVTSVKMGQTYNTIFRHLGVDVEKMTRIRHTTFCKELLYPSLPVMRREFIHPEGWKVYRKIAELGALSDIPVHERLYVSRTRMGPKRALENEAQIEAMFESYGFFVLHPQELSFPDQVRIFANAKIIAGPGGSALHNTVFSSPDVRVLILASSGWFITADMLIQQRPGQLGYVLGTPLAERPGRSHRNEGAWTIDPDEVRSALKQHFDL
jgi:capsular polysaccharide biosynthesis protein